MAGRLAGIARHGETRGAIGTLDRVAVSREAGIAGDRRGALKPGRNRRQVSLISAEGWAAALAEAGADLPWWQRRANLLVEGLALPRNEGAQLRIGECVTIEMTMECEPCSRMEEILPGLKAALTPDWRGGILGMVVEGGEIAIGDEVRVLG